MDKYNEMINIIKWTFVPILSIISGEILKLYGNIFLGFLMHIFTILAIIFLIIFGEFETLKIKNALQSLILFPLLRIISFSMPTIFVNKELQYLLMYGIMII